MRKINSLFGSLSFTHKLSKVRVLESTDEIDYHEYEGTVPYRVSTDNIIISLIQYYYFYKKNTSYGRTRTQPINQLQITTIPELPLGEMPERKKPKTGAGSKIGARTTYAPIDAGSEKIPSANINEPQSIPDRVLIVDNGGDTIKFGWNTDDIPQLIPNITARLPQQWSVLAGDQVSNIQNKNQLIGVTRSTERGIIVNLGNQVQVWKRMLDLLKVSIPLETETAHAFGWKLSKNENRPNIPAHTCAVLMTVSPYCPRILLDTIAVVWMQDFGFSHVGFCTATLVASVPHPLYETACCVDMGWSACHIVATHRGKVYAVRRLPIGGRHLVRIWQYHVSYRQYNLMDQEWILRDVMERTAFVAGDFMMEMRLADKLPAGKRPFDREYVLPDFQTTLEGTVRLPPALQREQDTTCSSSDDESMKEDVEEMEDVNSEGAISTEEVELDDEEETLEEKKQRLLRERAEEARRRRELEESHQVLQISVERFAVPEILFRPSDAHFPKEWPGLHQAIHQTIQECPEYLHLPLYKSVQVTGGLSKLENLSSRLYDELQRLAPVEVEVKLDFLNPAENGAWLGARRKSLGNLSEWSFTRAEWENCGRKGAWERLLGSILI